jgi:hypothetical protein
MLLLEVDLGTGCIWNKGNVSFKLLCFRYFLIQVIMTMLNSIVCWTTYKMDVTCGLLCWITTILACMLVGLKSLMILLDYRSYMGSNVRIWLLRWFFLYLCSYNLDGSMTRLRNYLLEHKKYQQAFLAPLLGYKPSSDVKKCQQSFLALLSRKQLA